MLQNSNHIPSKINSLKNRLQRLHEMAFTNYPELEDSIPSPDGIDITKLREHGMIMTDLCNAAQQARRLLQYQIGGVIFEIDCHHHLQNVWIKGMEKSVSVFLQVVVSDSLEQIPVELRVTCIFTALLVHGINFSAYARTIPKAKESILLHG